MNKININLPDPRPVKFTPTVKQNPKVGDVVFFFLGLDIQPTIGRVQEVHDGRVLVEYNTPLNFDLTGSIEVYGFTVLEARNNMIKYLQEHLYRHIIISQMDMVYYMITDGDGE